VPGVVLAEGQRIVATRLTAGHRSYRSAIVGISSDSELKVMRDRDLVPIPVPVEGLMLSRALADRLGVSVGDRIGIEVLEGERPIHELTLVKLSDDILGFSATMELGALNRLLREGDVINAAAIKVDASASRDVWRRLQEMPRIEASSVKSLWLILFNDTIAGMLAIGATILASFGILIAVGVVYNSARVALQERAWELASLRILGFTRGEVTGLLLTELAFALVIAIPTGLLIGRGLIHLIISARGRESFQMPAVIEPTSYVIAFLVILGAGLASAFLIRRRIDRLDLVGVLKTRD
jgi:putative ABC transport system permease protein